jgi:hypothetical protein
LKNAAIRRNPDVLSNKKLRTLFDAYIHVLKNKLVTHSQKLGIAPAGFEPASGDPESPILGR